MSSFFIELGHKNLAKHGNIVSGDVFLYRKIVAENRIIAILSDGLGSGIKANVLASMTASMGLKFIEQREPIERMAEVILSTLPVDSERMISYATFTILDVDYEGNSRIVEFGNPPAVIFRNGDVLELERKTIFFHNDNPNQQELWVTTFKAQRHDRIVFFSDGISQSGIGNIENPFGWEQENAIDFLKEKLQIKPRISAEQLSKSLIYKAHRNDNYKCQDDTSCASVYFRKPRCLLVCTGPPYDEHDDPKLLKMYDEFKGNRVICGGTTANIISEGRKEEVEMDLKNISPDIPPMSKISSALLITEGIITLGRVAKILEGEVIADQIEKNAAGELVKIFFNHDVISFVVGTKVNNAHQDPNLPVDLGIRRSQIKKIESLLSNKYLKETSIRFI